MLRAAASLLVALTFFAPPAIAQIKPCSGKKGGISHCEGEAFVCNDGSASASKRSCSAYLGGASRQAPSTRAAPSASCSCSSGSYCTGPRGGRYCVTSTGSKRYARKE